RGGLAAHRRRLDHDRGQESPAGCQAAGALRPQERPSREGSVHPFPMSAHVDESRTETMRDVLPGSFRRARSARGTGGVSEHARRAGHPVTSQLSRCMTFLEHVGQLGRRVLGSAWHATHNLHTIWFVPTIVLLGLAAYFLEDTRASAALI